MFAGGFDFSFPAVDRFDRGGVDVDAGGEVFLEEGAGDFAGFGERGAGYEDEAELGGGHGFLGGIVVDLRKEESLTQRRLGRREEKIRRVVALDRKSPPIAKSAKGGAPSSSDVGWRHEEHGQEWMCFGESQEGRASPAPTRITGVTVECGDYGYYTDCFAD